MVNIGNDWDELLKEEFASENYQNIRRTLKEEYANATVYPSMFDIFNAFRYTAYKDVKVVILGQDPYHNPGQAHGLAFSVKDGVEPPPSLKNIYKELHSDVGMEIPGTGNLIPWTKQGVMLLNTVLTVRENEANSHKDIGWQEFTDHVISLLSAREEPMVFLLWGGNARSKRNLIDKSRHLVLECAHPSPLSAYNGFFGCKHFSKANAFLKQHGEKEIDWQL